MPSRRPKSPALYAGWSFLDSLEKIELEEAMDELEQLDARRRELNAAILALRKRGTMRLTRAMQRQ